MAASIGIKEANGDFFPIFEENSTVKKRLVLTTVHDNQKSVQIDLYRSLKKSMNDAVYIGSIVVENVSPKAKGEPSIEMAISSTQDGSVSASAVDLNNPSNEHHLSVSLKSLEEDKNDYPDFDIESSQSDQRRITEPIMYERKFPWLIIVLVGLVLVLLCLGLWFFLFRNKNPGSGKTAQAKPAVEQTRPAAAEPAKTEKSAQTASQPAAEVQQPKPAAEPQQSQTSAPAPPPSPPPPQAEQKKPVVVEKPPRANSQAPARVRKPAPVFSFAVPETIPPEGIAYTIRWGDTLWDVSEAFYRNPRLYTYIVRTNGIRNPSLVASGTELTILPRE
jgi:hypothetical protein